MFATMTLFKAIFVFYLVTAVCRYQTTATTVVGVKKHVRTEQSGTIRAPGTVAWSTDTVRHEWLISTPANTNLTFSFDHFELPTSDGCRFAYVDIFDGKTTFVRKLNVKKMCGHHRLDDNFKASGNSLVLVYYAQENVTSRGFTFRWATGEGGNGNKFEDDEEGMDCTMSSLPQPNTKRSVAVVTSQNEAYWPWVAMVTADQLTNRTYGIICQGTITSLTHIVTSWDCVKHFRSSGIVVYVGKHVVTMKDSSEQRIAIKKIYRTANNSESGDSGFAVMALERKLTVTPYVTSACLSDVNVPIIGFAKGSKGKNGKGSNCYLAGWNIGDATGRFSPQKGAVALNMIDQSEMANVIKRLDYEPHEGLQCALTSVGVIIPKTCRGASIVCYTRRRWLVHGIVKEVVPLQSKETAIFFAPVNKRLIQIQEEFTELEDPFLAITA